MYRRLMSSVLFALPMIFLAGANAQEWPTKSVRFVVPFAPGGTSEIIAQKLM